MTLFPNFTQLISILFVLTTALCACNDESFTNISPEEYSYSKPTDLSDGLTVATPGDLQLDAQPFDDLIKNILSGDYQSIDSVLIYTNGSLILEEYFNGYNQDKLHDLRSASKSITSLLVGLAIDKKYIRSIDEPVYPFFENSYVSFKNGSRSKQEISIKHLLNMASGLECNDDDPSSAGNEDKMYRYRDWYKFILDLEVIDKPGDVFSYCTGGVNLLGGVIRHASNMKIKPFSQEYLFTPLGIDNFRWSYAANQAADTGGHLYLRPRDLLKIGVLFLSDGNWQSEQVVSSSWIDLSKEKYFSNYGYLWWKNEIEIDENGTPFSIPVILASGNGGQIIYIIPSLQSVIVFTGSNYNNFWGGYGPFLMMKDLILPTLKNNQP